MMAAELLAIPHPTAPLGTKDDGITDELAVSALTLYVKEKIS